MTRSEKKTQYIKQIMVRLSKVYRPQSFAYQCTETALRKFSSTELDCFYIMLITSQDSIESIKPPPKEKAVKKSKIFPVKEYPETHQQGIISIENKDEVLDRNNDFTQVIEGDLGIQIAKNGKVWICINGVSFIRFNLPLKNGDGDKNERVKQRKPPNGCKYPYCVNYQEDAKTYCTTGCHIDHRDYIKMYPKKVNKRRT